MTTTKRDLTFLALIFMGIAMAEPTLEKQFEQGLNEAERAAFYEIFGNNDQEGVSDEPVSNEQD
jgi:transketolase